MNCSPRGYQGLKALSWVKQFRKRASIFALLGSSRRAICSPQNLHNLNCSSHHQSCWTTSDKTGAIDPTLLVRCLNRVRYHIRYSFPLVFPWFQTRRTRDCTRKDPESAKTCDCNGNEQFRDMGCQFLKANYLLNFRQFPRCLHVPKLSSTCQIIILKL